MKPHTLFRSPILAVGALFVFEAAMTACGGAQDNAQGTTTGQVTAGNATGSTCPETSTLTYANFGQAFISTHCLSCHGSRQSPALATQSAVRAASAQIDRVAAAGPDAINAVMPPDASLTTDDRLNLGEWLACGAP
jgi:hypothetical protein